MNAASTNRLLYAIIFTLSLTEFLQAGMTAFAAVPIMGEIGIGPDEFSFIAAAYASLAILAISMHRWWIERFGARRFIQACAALSIGGSLLCATSHDFNGLLLGRAVMALGGGAFFTASRMIIQHRLAGPQRFVGIRCLATGLAIGIAMAPWLATLAVVDETWAAIYALVALLGGLIFVLASWVLDGGPRDVPQRRSHAGPWSQVLLLGSSFALLYALQRMYYDFDADMLSIGLTLAAALAGLLLYGHRQHYEAEPLLRVREMWSPRYLGGLAIFAFAYLMLGANNYAVPILLQRALGFTWHTVGQIQTVGLAAALLTWLVMSRLLPRYPSPRKYFVVGFLSLALSGALLARIDSGVNLWRHVVPALALNSVFLLTVLPVAAMQTYRSVEHDESVFSHAQQLKNMMGQAGIALGITLATVGQQWRGAVHQEVLVAQINPYNPNFVATLQHLQQALSATMAPPAAAQAAMAQVAQMVAQQSALLAGIDHFGMIAALGLLGVMVTLVQRTFR